MSRPDRSDALLVAQVTVSRYLTADGEEQIDVDAVSVDGTPLEMVTTLGLLTVAQMTYSVDCGPDHV